MIQYPTNQDLYFLSFNKKLKNPKKQEMMFGEKPIALIQNKKQMLELADKA